MILRLSGGFEAAQLAERRIARRRESSPQTERVLELGGGELGLTFPNLLQCLFDRGSFLCGPASSGVGRCLAAGGSGSRAGAANCEGDAAAGFTGDAGLHGDLLDRGFAAVSAVGFVPGNPVF